MKDLTENRLDFVPAKPYSSNELIKKSIMKTYLKKGIFNFLIMIVFLTLNILVYELTVESDALNNYSKISDLIFLLFVVISSTGTGFFLLRTDNYLNKHNLREDQ